MLLKKTHRSIGEEFHGMFTADPFVLKGVSGGDVLQGEFVGIAHPAEKYGLALLKAAQSRLAAIVPFAGHEGGVSRPGKLFWPGRLRFELLMDAEEGPTTHEHGAGRHADRPVVGTHAVGTVKYGAAFGEMIERGGLDDGITEGGNRVCPLIIAEKEENIWSGEAGQPHQTKPEKEPETESEREPRVFHGRAGRCKPTVNEFIRERISSIITIAGNNSADRLLETSLTFLANAEGHVPDLRFADSIEHFDDPLVACFVFGLDRNESSSSSAGIISV